MTLPSTTTESDSTAVRRPLVLEAMFQVLTAEDGPLTAQTVLERVSDRVELTPAELSRNKSGQTRVETFLRFASGWASRAGWITKGREGWLLTDYGRENLAGRDAETVYATLTKEYRAIAKAGKAADARQNDPRYAKLLDLMSLLDEGEWATYTDIGELAGVSPQNVGKFVNTTPTAEGHRLLLIDGRCGEDFAWAVPRPESQREVLESEGLVFGVDGVADEQARVHLEDLNERYEAAGFEPAPPKRAWLVRGNNVNGVDLVPEWLRKGQASLSAASLREVTAGISRGDLAPLVDEDYAHASYSAKKEKLDAFHAFLSRMQPGHVVVTVDAGKLHLGEVAGSAEYVSDDTDTHLRMPVAWRSRALDIDALPEELQARLKVQRDVLDLTQQLSQIEELIEARTSVPKPTKVVLPDATDELAASLHVSKEWLQECIELLNDRPQLVFYGPPGTGKTYIAQKLAKHVAGDKVRLVQFHPSYSYEDFFEGYRPTKEGGFDLTPGPMRRVVDSAKDNPSVAHVLIIDEMNRGNLAKVFGELYFLLEYREEAIELLYGEGDFNLPPNVFIIGTMNTADRSIALVDAAMRRRFAFKPLHPSEEPTNGVLRQWLVATERPTRVADLLDELNGQILDEDFKIGPSYFMRPAVFDDGGLERTWRTSILPLLEEHHYGEMSTSEVAARYGYESIAKRVDVKAVPEADASEEATGQV
jgi:5-methylcytosine-specific restriction protein B